MLKRTVLKLQYLFILAVLAVLPLLPINAHAGFNDFDPVDQTDAVSYAVVYFWDLRMARQTYAQLTNMSQFNISVHVQIFNVASPAVICEETNFDDIYTPGDTHVYDLSNLVSNNDADGLGFVGNSAPNADLDEGYGLIVVSTPRFQDVLIGMFRIIDGDSDFEYRTNAAGEIFFNNPRVWTTGVLNFNNVDGANLSDVVGLVYRRVGSFSVTAGPHIQALFGDATGDVTDPTPQIHIFDEFESPTSCSPTTFTCDTGLVDKAIDNFHPNSKGEVNRICNDSVDVGWLFMPLQRFFCFDVDPDGGDCSIGNGGAYFVGFLGLNNGDGTGSMDSWWTPSPDDETPLP